MGGQTVKSLNDLDQLFIMLCCLIMFWSFTEILLFCIYITILFFPHMLLILKTILILYCLYSCYISFDRMFASPLNVAKIKKNKHRDMELVFSFVFTKTLRKISIFGVVFKNTWIIIMYNDTYANLLQLIFIQLWPFFK